ncbi:MAG: ABC transporter permease [Bacteroidota bacterium]
MIKNYFKIAFRNFSRHKLNSFINLVGLSIGLAACILITMYVSHERSYDKFHADAERIFNLVGKFDIGGETITMSRLSAVAAPMIKENSDNVEDALRYYDHGQSVRVKTNDSEISGFVETELAATDANFFSFLSFELLQGNPKTALEKPFSLVLTKSKAEKYFGQTNPIGQQLTIEQDSTYKFTVTGVTKDFPTNSSLKPELLISFNSLQTMKETEFLTKSQYFQGGSFSTLVKVFNIENKSEVDDTATRLDRLHNEEADTSYALNAFTDAHLAKQTGRFNYLNVFPIVALLILILALTNYISLTTARAGTRSKEVGVRKVSGASRRSIAVQFYLESAIFVCVSFVIGIILSLLFKNQFLSLLNIEIDVDFYFNQTFIWSLLGVLLFAVVISGIYPAMVLSSFNPIKNFRNKTAVNTGSVTVRKVFTTFQFTIAVLLIVCGIVMTEQLDFMRNKDTGLQRSDLVMIPVETTMNNNAGAFRNEVGQLPGVDKTTVAVSKMYGGYNAYFVTPDNGDKNYTVVTYSVDEHFIETLGVEWLVRPEERTAFSANKKVIINEKTISELALKPDPRGELLNFGSQSFEVAAVVKDFNYSSLESPIKPLAFFISSESVANDRLLGAQNSYLYVKFSNDVELKNTLDAIENIYGNFDKSTPFSYEFMDDAFDTLYKAEEQLSFIFYVFMVLALVIAGLGLLGLITFIAEKRVKEIGIRKVMGASISEIVTLLSSDFIKLVVIAILIAMPIAWYFSSSWLSYFAYQAAIPWWSFVVAALVAILLSVTTLSFQSIKAAMANPADSLRSE